MATTTVSIKHNAEMAHRLPVLPGKCQNLHGHSWQFEIEVEGEMDINGVIIEYGAFKKVVRDWIDRELDHGTALGQDDPLVAAFAADPYHKKTFVCSVEEWGFDWPTVEAMSHIVANATQGLIDTTVGLRGTVVSVKVQETGVNAATWRIGSSQLEGGHVVQYTASAS